MRRALTLLPAVLLLATPPGEAAAQASGATPGMIPQRGEAAPQQAPAPALPGLSGRRTPAPIEADPAANLSPNAALFDAINRGDLAAVRDAVGRGASLDARNRLGLTPIDAAVDQGRTEISFYLLSARDTSRSPAPPPPGTALDAPPAT
ncbi:ankyrin repeat domain-containing protein, partial [Falsiroseomonas sp. CW058]|uniref:ankyrin repeat domain-containing protein n=1 Tax=Falsiroseomonas sp. CW058 TaxID=3388664 RepID=UPI003D31D3E2